jgi:hypothetical protein
MKLNCSRVHQRFGTNPRRAFHVCNVPFGRERNPRGAQFVRHTHPCVKKLFVPTSMYQNEAKILKQNGRFLFFL